MNIDFNKLEPEAQKAIEDIVKILGFSIQQEPKPENMGCVGDCMPPILTKPTTDAMMEGLVGVFKIFERIQSVYYNKGETEIKLEIVIGIPQPAKGGQI